VAKDAGRETPCPSCTLTLTLPTPEPRHVKPVVIPKNCLICPTCGQLSFGRKKPKGSPWIEILLWLCFLVPGIIYTIWRCSGDIRVCPACESRGLIPANTPRGQVMVNEFLAAGQFMEVPERSILGGVIDTLGKAVLAIVILIIVIGIVGVFVAK